MVNDIVTRLRNESGVLTRNINDRVALMDEAANAIEAADKRARLHAQRGNGLAEELDKAYAHITELTREIEGI